MTTHADRARDLNPPAAKRRRRAAPEATDVPPTRRVFGYARVSTVAQADEGESLDVQHASSPATRRCKA